jgi:signal transduction histidine kinase
MVYPEDLPKANEEIRKALETGEFNTDWRIVRPDGEIRWMNARAKIFYDGEGKPAYMVGINMDITERKAIESDLKRQARELERLNASLVNTGQLLSQRNQELDRFVYVVSHDLKAPLRAIANLSEWIEEDLEGQLPEDSRRQMELLRNRVGRLVSLIDGLLVYSRVGRTEVRAETFAVGHLLEEVIDSLAPPAIVSIEIGAGMPTLTTKKLLMAQVFSNLIGNAIKHNDRPDGKISISVTPRGDFYEFSVRDNGPGIPAEHHERIFGIFETLNSRDKKESTGIGLSIVKKIIDTEGGTIHVESAVGKGATFRFTWPESDR